MVGVSPDRVMLIKADMPGDGRSVGSGTLVGPSLVLTAAHVVFDKNGNPSSHVRVIGADANPVAADIVWPATFTDESGDPDELDAALLRITAQSWTPPRLGAVRWGRLTGQTAGVRCEATGFPRALVGSGGQRDSDQVSAEINPGSRRVAGRYDLNVTSSVPTPLRDRPSPWGGLSGAGVFANGLLIAVVIVDERGSFSGDRLSALPIHRLAADPQFVALVEAAGGGLSGPGQLESVELVGVLNALSTPMTRRGGGQSRSPAMLLRPELGVVPFHGRDEITRTLVGWCQSSERELDVVLLTGPGGQGKTRMARHLAGQMLSAPNRDGSPGWVCGWLDATAGDAGLASLADTDSPLLVLIDYAETRTEQLRSLLAALNKADTIHPTRVLMLARAAGEWWTGLAPQTDWDPGEVIALPPLDAVDDRAAQFASAAGVFADRLQSVAAGAALVDVASLRPPEDIGHTRYGSPLTLQLAALTAVLNAANPLPEQASRVHAEEALLRHEKQYWIDTAYSAGLDLHADTLRRAVAAATLCGAVTFDDVKRLVRAVPGLGDLTEDAVQRLDTWLKGVYPPDAGQRWGSLQPDRLGEYLIATEMAKVPSLLSGLLSTIDVARQHRALSIIARAIGNPALAGPEWDRFVAQVRDAVSESVVWLGPVALQVITETAYPQTMLEILHDAVGSADEVVLNELVDALPTHSQVLAEPAALWSARQIDHLRGHVETVGDHVALARALVNYASRVADLGRLEDAVAASTDAVDLYRLLDASEPNTFGPHLALALNNLYGYLWRQGAQDAAVAAITEAIGIYERLVAQRPEFLGEWAMSLNNVSYAFTARGDHERALDAAGGAVDVFRRLVEPGGTDTERHLLASALTSLSHALAKVGRPEEAVAAATEAVEISRTLALSQPDRFTTELTTPLNALAIRLQDVGRDSEALAVLAESADVFRQLAATRPEVFAPDLAVALDYFSTSLAKTGHLHESVAVRGEAIDVRRRLADAHPAEHVAELARLLVQQSLVLTDLDRCDEAGTALTETATVYQRLAPDQLDSTGPAIAMAFDNFANRLESMLQFEQALAATTAAIAVYGDLMTSNPDEFFPGAARAMYNQGLLLMKIGDYDEALAAIEHVVSIYRELLDPEPELTPDLANMLVELSRCLSLLGRHDEALSVNIEALTMYRMLAAQDAAFRPHVARTLAVRGHELATAGDVAGAVTADRDAVSMFAALTPDDADWYRGYRDLAIELLQGHLRELGRSDEQITDELHRLLDPS